MDVLSRTGSIDCLCMYMLDPSSHHSLSSRASGIVEGFAAEEELEGWRRWSQEEA